MEYDQATVDQEFSVLALLAADRVHEFEQAFPDNRAAHQHDEALAEYSVYEFLRPRPFLASRKSLLAELRWFLVAEPHVPENAYSVARFTSSRHSLTKKLIQRFD
jgi:hypothetical protein